MPVLVYKYRVKGRRMRKLLNRQANAINTVWNYCNDAQRHAQLWGRDVSRYELQKLTKGCSKEIGLHSQTIQGVCERYSRSRQQRQKNWLRFRGIRSPGWVPLSGRNIKHLGEDKFWYMGVIFRVWLSRPMQGTLLCGSSFNTDTLGNWYINLCYEAPLQPSAPTGAVGVDLGIKTAATMSHGEAYEGGRPFQEIEPSLAVAQRARKKKRIIKLHAKARNRRKDALHKLSTRLVRENALVAVGNVSSQSMIKMRFAKGALDAGWGMLRSFLRYKRLRAGVRYEEVDENLSSQTCSDCGSLPDSRPAGIACLRIRAWECSDCGASHDRDVNAARNILALALRNQRPVEGILF